MSGSARLPALGLAFIYTWLYRTFKLSVRLSVDETMEQCVEFLRTIDPTNIIVHLMLNKCASEMLVLKAHSKNLCDPGESGC